MPIHVSTEGVITVFSPSPHRCAGPAGECPEIPRVPWDGWSIPSPGPSCCGPMPPDRCAAMVPQVCGGAPSTVLS